MADHQTIDYITSVIRDVLASGGITVTVSYEDSLADGLLFNIASTDAKMLIGHQGATLYALEHIVHAIVARQLSKTGTRIFFSIDVDEYKKKRQYHLKQLAKDAIEDIKRTNNAVSLPAMSSSERRYVHMYVTEQYPHVKTESIGIDPHRHIKLSL